MKKPVITNNPYKQAYLDRRQEVATQAVLVAGGTVYLDERNLPAVRIPARRAGVTAIDITTDNTLRVTVTCEATIDVLKQIVACFGEQRQSAANPKGRV